MRVTVQFRSRVQSGALPLFCIYVLYLHFISAKCDRYYIGSSEDIIKRLARHNAGQVTSTKLCRPWEIKYIEEFPERAVAIAREFALKKMKSRVYLEWLIRTKK